MRDMDTCDRLSFEFLRIDDHQITGLKGQIDHQADHPSFILSTVFVCWYEHELTRMTTRAKLVHEAFAGLHVVLE